MKYKIDVRRFGRFFAVPCNVVEKNLKLADANYVKALLAVLCSDCDEADTKELAQACGISESAAEDALLYWQECGIFTACKTDGKTAVAVNAATAEKTAVPVCVTDAVNPMKNTAAAKSVIRYSNKELAEKARQNKELQTMFDEIQRVFGRPINSTETAGLVNLYEYYGYDVPSIVMIAEFCSSIGKGKIAYIESVAKDWFSRGICDFTQVEQEIIHLTEQHGFDAEVARRLGIEGKLTKKQLEYFSQWKEWGFDEKLIDLAGERCREKKNKTDIRYINGILGRWKQNNLLTVEAVEEQERQYKQSRTAVQTEAASYNFDGWRDRANSFNPNTLGFEEDDDI